MYIVNSGPLPLKRSRDSAQAAGAPMTSCPATEGITSLKLFQNITKNPGVSKSSSVMGASVGQVGKSGQLAMPSRPASTGPTVCVSSSSGISAPVNMNHSTHHSGKAQKTSTAKMRIVLRFACLPPCTARHLHMLNHRCFLRTAASA